MRERGERGEEREERGGGKRDERGGGGGGEWRADRGERETKG